VRGLGCACCAPLLLQSETAQLAIVAQVELSLLVLEDAQSLAQAAIESSSLTKLQPAHLLATSHPDCAPLVLVPAEFVLEGGNSGTQVTIGLSVSGGLFATLALQQCALHMVVALQALYLSSMALLLTVLVSACLDILCSPPTRLVGGLIVKDARGGGDRVGEVVLACVGPAGALESLVSRKVMMSGVRFVRALLQLFLMEAVARLDFVGAVPLLGVLQASLGGCCVFSFW
jgi:hypothetical protein